jgi:hypothetical protein
VGHVTGRQPAETLVGIERTASFECAALGRPCGVATPMVFLNVAGDPAHVLNDERSQDDN